MSVDSAFRGVLPAPGPRQAFATRIALSEGAGGELVMTVETTDRPGLLLAITRALFRAGVQIVSSNATTTDGLVSDRFALVETDGSPIGEKRRRALQTDVLAAVDSVARRPR
jgi:[protein-PII] uridylyltransferase